MALPDKDEGDDAELSLLHPLVRALIDAAPNKLSVLQAMLENFEPLGGWSGSRAQILQRRRDGIAELAAHPHPVVRGWTGETLPRLDDSIRRALEWEERMNKRDERFE